MRGYICFASTALVNAFSIEHIFFLAELKIVKYNLHGDLLVTFSENKLRKFENDNIASLVIWFDSSPKRFQLDMITRYIENVDGASNIWD